MCACVCVRVFSDCYIPSDGQPLNDKSFIQIWVVYSFDAQLMLMCLHIGWILLIRFISSEYGGNFSNRMEYMGIVMSDLLHIWFEINFHNRENFKSTNTFLAMMLPVDVSYLYFLRRSWLVLWFQLPARSWLNNVLRFWESGICARTQQ